MRLIIGLVFVLLGSAYAQDSYYGSDDNGNRYGDWDAGSPNEVEAGGLSMFAGVDLWTVISDRTTHGILAACSFAVLFPAGAILVRLPWRHAWIFHALAQGIACILYIAAAAIGIRLIDVVRIPPSGTSLLQISPANAHPIIGIILLIAIFIQPQLGFAHHSRFKRFKRRTIFSHAHLWLGRVSITLGIVNGGLGLKLANADRRATTTYIVVAGIFWVLWLAAAILGEIRRRQNLKRAVPRPVDTDDVSPSTSYPPGAARPNPTHWRSRHPIRHHVGLEDPSPPYLGGSHVVEGEAVEMQPIKEPARCGSETISSLSSEQTLRDAGRRF